MGNNQAKKLTSVKAPDAVYGMAVVDRTLYVLRKRNDDQIYVYERHSGEYKLQKTMTVPGLKPNCYNDMTECQSEMCLFVSDFDAKCIHKVTYEGKVSKFVDVPHEPKGLSITPEGNLLVTCNSNKLIEFNVKTGEKVHELELEDVMFPKHAVKRKDGQYVVCHAVDKKLSRVLRVGTDGLYRHCYGGAEGSGDGQLNCPCHLALREDNYVIVADNNNNRLVLLDQSLEFVGYLVEDFREPHRVWFDSASRRLYVGECTDNGSIVVFQT